MSLRRRICRLGTGSFGLFVDAQRRDILFCLWAGFVGAPFAGHVSTSNHTFLVDAVPSAYAANSATTTAPTSVRRFAVAIGVNDGGKGRTYLRYAATDAQSVASVLQELGGFSNNDIFLVQTPERRAVDQALADVSVAINRAKSIGQRTELLVYYSGHSDENGLLLGTTRFDYRDLRRAISNVPSDVRVVVLDSCASGAFTRAKGGKHKPALRVDSNSQSDVSGYAFLTSSSADEVAQESDHLQGSFFTHALVSGLRGGADEDSDGQVTLDEAYRFAFDETLAHTSQTQGGAQHPAYDIGLSGTGSLVLTDLAKSKSTLIVDKQEGTVLVRSASGASLGKIVAESPKPKDKDIRVSLPPGLYDVAIELPQKDNNGQRQVYRGQIRLSSGKDARLSTVDLQPILLQQTALRGERIATIFQKTPGDLDGLTAAQVWDSVLPLPLNLSLVSPLETNSFSPHRTLNQLGVHLLWGQSNVVTGLQLSGGGNWVIDDLFGIQIAPFVNGVGHNAYGWQISPVVNYTRNRMYGWQLGAVNVGGWVQGLQSGALNLAEASRGGQIGLVNIGSSVDGAQIGLINIAEQVAGAQIGLVNYSTRMHGAPLGLLSVAGNGAVHAGIASNDWTLLDVNGRLGMEYLYTTAHLFINPWTSSVPLHGFGIGLGGRFDVEQIGFSLEALLADIRHSGLSAGDLSALGSVRFQVSFQPLPTLPTWNRLRIYGGISANMTATTLDPNAPQPINPLVAMPIYYGSLLQNTVDETGATTTILRDINGLAWLGWFVGAEF